jgi:hypothetical protein
MIISLRNAFLIYSLLFLALVTPYWLGGEVIAPNRQAEMVGLPDPGDAGHIQNDFFNDSPTTFVPETAVLLHGPRSGWLALWTPYNELGRPFIWAGPALPIFRPGLLRVSLTSRTGF